MGLVLLSPADTLASVLATAPSANANPGDAATSADSFATLVQAMRRNPATMPAAGALAELPELPQAPHEPGRDSDDLAAALAAALALLQSTTAPVVPEPAAKADAAHDPVAPTTGPSALPGMGVDSSTALLPGESGAASVPAVAADGGAGDGASPTAPGTSPGSIVADPTQSASGGLPALTVAALALPPGAPPSTTPERTRARHDDDDAPAAGPPGATAPLTGEVFDTTSVVRSVGNAQQNNGSPSGQGGPGHEFQRPAAAGDAAATIVTAAGPLDASSRAATAAPPPAGGSAPAPLAPSVEQVARTVIEQVQQGGGEARIHLHPAELGEVVIRVHTDGDHVRVDVRADHAEAMNLLRDHTADLSNLLGGRGLNLSDVYVGLGGQSAGSNGQDEAAGGDANSPAKSEFATLLGIDEPATAIDSHLRLRAAYNPDGALSYRV